MNDSIVVLYECWQMECCGIPFTVGCKIKWPVAKTFDRIGVPASQQIDFIYDAHSEYSAPVEHPWPAKLNTCVA